MAKGYLRRNLGSQSPLWLSFLFGVMLKAEGPFPVRFERNCAPAPRSLPLPGAKKSAFAQLFIPALHKKATLRVMSTSLSMSLWLILGRLELVVCFAASNSPHLASGLQSYIDLEETVLLIYQALPQRSVVINPTFSGPRHVLYQSTC